MSLLPCWPALKPGVPGSSGREAAPLFSFRTWQQLIACTENAVCAKPDVAAPVPDSHGAVVLQVAGLQGRRGAPHVLLITQSLGFGRQAEKVVAAADALVQPYLAGEPLPRDLLLPMSCGKPIVTTEAGPAAHLVGDREGYLVRSRWGPCNATAAGAGGGGEKWRMWDEEEGEMVEAEAQQAQQGALGDAGDMRRDVCREVDPESLASVLSRVHADAAGRHAKGKAAATAAKELVERQGWDAMARQAWLHVEARLGPAVPVDKQHRKLIV
jgi:hypothetical protein